MANWNRIFFAIAFATIGNLVTTSDVLGVTLTFDGISTLEEGPMPIQYGGLNWHNFGYTTGATLSVAESGYDNGRISGDYTAFNYSDNNSEIIATVTGSPFTFNYAYLTAAWNDNLNVRVRGYLLGALRYDRTVVVNTTAPTFVTYNYTDIDWLEFSSFGGIRVNQNGAGTHFAMDNFTFNIPEPTALTLLCLGSVCLLRRGYSHAAR